MTSARPPTLLAWALYDLANTFFAVAILSFYFPLWLVQDQGVKELAFSASLGVSMVCVAVIMPVCGAIADATGQRVRYLWWTTLGCVLLTAAIGCLQTVWLALVFFAAANVCYQLGTVFYDALLRHVGPADRLGASSGFGAAFGYVGSMVGLASLWPFVRAGGYHAAFIPSAVLFFLFALPSFMILRDPPAPRSMAWRAVIRQGFHQLAATISHARSYRPVWWFFIACFFSLNAINTILVFMAVYTKRVLGFSDAELIRFFLVGQGCAVIGALVGGQVVQRLGAKRTLAFVWGGWLLALSCAVLTRDVRAWWLIGPVIGFCLGPTWATSRVLLIDLAPPHQLAEFFGLAGLLGRASSVIGPILWGLIVWDPSRYRHALVALIGLLAIGIWMLQRVPAAAPARAQV